VVPPSILSTYFSLFAFVLGAAIGSFLNVCIYRMPRNLSVNNPRRSFCPNCNYQIPWSNNLPLVSWLVLRGKCANCGSRIAFRYFGVELLTGLLFLAIWRKVWPDTWILALPYWILMSLFVAATFIDFEHFIIPDEITWGGAIAGVLLSFAIPLMHAGESRMFPSLQGENSPLYSGLWAIAGAAAGYGLLWIVVEIGKLVFGKKRLDFEKPAPMKWTRNGLEADLNVGEEKTMLWSDFFARGHEELHMKCAWIEIDGDRHEDVSARWTLDWIHIGDRKWQLEKTGVIAGEVTQVVLPREAMGLGDVKFLACIGAFLGWEAVLFTVVAASMVGSVVGGTAILARRREWSVRIPFGPYLAFGAVVWIFAGPQNVHWYFQFAAAPP
jgi:leader peptidase (prepilin peptidase)/N-methyltransferase